MVTGLATAGNAYHGGKGRLQIIYKDRWVPPDLRARLARYSPKSELGRIVKECFRFLPAEQAAELLERISSCVVIESMLSVVVLRHPDSPYRRGGPLVEDYGVTSRKVVTDNGVGYLVDGFQNLVELENMKFHGLGTGSTAEAATDAALVTELTTQYNPDNTRATGTTVEGASANIYKSVGTNTLDGAATVAEHGIFSAASAGVLLDRSLTGTQTLASGDGLQATYQLTCSSGG